MSFKLQGRSLWPKLSQSALSILLAMCLGWGWSPDSSRSNQDPPDSTLEPWGSQRWGPSSFELALGIHEPEMARDAWNWSQPTGNRTKSWVLLGDLSKMAHLVCEGAPPHSLRTSSGAVLLPSLHLITFTFVASMAPHFAMKYLCWASPALQVVPPTAH